MYTRRMANTRMWLPGLMLVASFTAVSCDNGPCTGDCQCSGNECVCPSTGDCAVDCTDACDLQCAGSGDCDFACSNGCQASCTGSGECLVVAGDDSLISCTGSGDCDITCVGDCVVECPGSGVCIARCDAGFNCEITRCEDVVSCPDGVQVCNGACPP
jgi:hypothetical protein